MKNQKSSIFKKIFYSRILFYVVLLLAVFILLLYNFIYNNFNNITLEQLLYSVENAEGTNTDAIWKGVFDIFSKMFIFIILYIAIVKIIKRKKSKTYVKIKLDNHTKEFPIIPLKRSWQNALAIIFLILSFTFVFVKVEAYSLFIHENSTFIEDNYVDPKNVKISAAKTPHNLIYIYVESLENTFFSIENGGAYNKSVIPNLENLAENNINFSHTKSVGGGNVPIFATWTVAGMVAQTAGIPLKVSGIKNEYGANNFLPGVYSLGDILKENDYSNYIMFGSPGKFAGRSDYFSTHGDYTIYDYDYAVNKKWIDENYKVWWGFEDSKLFKFAKKELAKISTNEEPFNFTLLTADTHFIDGYIDKKCNPPFDNHYLNSFYCSDSEIGDFIKWLEKQDFYDDTTIVITGDHLTMQDIDRTFDVSNKKNYQRTLYNVFINPNNEDKSYVKNRSFNSYDLYPTTLSALGFEIAGNRLGLGTNLFSGKKTLAEKVGHKYIDIESKKDSEFYSKKLLEDISKSVNN